MITVKEHIRGRLFKFGIRLSDVDIDVICGKGNLNSYDEYEQSMETKVEYGIALFIPELQAVSQSYSVSENGHSKSETRNAKGLLNWYSILCKKFGLKDLLSDKPTIRMW
jgi:hypothetical protein